MRYLMTQGIKALIDADENFGAEVARCLARFIDRDYGDLCPEDAELNRRAWEEQEGRLFAVYNIGTIKIWIIQDDVCGGEETPCTILLPEEY